MCQYISRTDQFHCIFHPVEKWIQNDFEFLGSIITDKICCYIINDVTIQHFRVLPAREDLHPRASKAGPGVDKPKRDSSAWLPELHKVAAEQVVAGVAGRLPHSDILVIDSFEATWASQWFPATYCTDNQALERELGVLGQKGLQLALVPENAPGHRHLPARLLTTQTVLPQWWVPWEIVPSWEGEENRGWLHLREEPLLQGLAQIHYQSVPMDRKILDPRHQLRLAQIDTSARVHFRVRGQSRHQVQAQAQECLLCGQFPAEDEGSGSCG